MNFKNDDGVNGCGQGVACVREAVLEAPLVERERLGFPVLRVDRQLAGVVGVGVVAGRAEAAVVTERAAHLDVVTEKQIVQLDRARERSQLAARAPVRGVDDRLGVTERQLHRPQARFEQTGREQRVGKPARRLADGEARAVFLVEPPVIEVTQRHLRQALTSRKSLAIGMRLPA